LETGSDVEILNPSAEWVRIRAVESREKEKAPAKGAFSQSNKLMATHPPSGEKIKIENNGLRPF